MEEGGGEEDAGSKAEQAGGGDYLRRWKVKFIMVQVIRQQPDFSWLCPPRSGQEGGGVLQPRGLGTIIFMQGLGTMVEQSDVGGWEDIEEYWLWMSRHKIQTSTRI